MKLSDITVEQFIKLTQIEEAFKGDENRIFREVNLLFNFDSDRKISEAKDFHLKLSEALSSEPRFIQRFTHKGIEYGFIPNLREISTGEYIDLDTYQRDISTYAKMLSILYRPITRSVRDLYSIEEYSGVKYEDVMKEVSCEILLGSIRFFFLLSKSILEHLTISSLKMQNQKMTEQ